MCASLHAECCMPMVCFVVCCVQSVFAVSTAPTAHWLTDKWKVTPNIKHKYSSPGQLLMQKMPAASSITPRGCSLAHVYWLPLALKYEPRFLSLWWCMVLLRTAGLKSAEYGVLYLEVVVVIPFRRILMGQKYQLHKFRAIISYEIIKVSTRSVWIKNIEEPMSEGGHRSRQGCASCLSRTRQLVVRITPCDYTKLAETLNQQDAPKTP